MSCLGAAESSTPHSSRVRKVRLSVVITESISSGRVISAPDMSVTVAPAATPSPAGAEAEPEPAAEPVFAEPEAGASAAPP